MGVKKIDSSSQDLYTDSDFTVTCVNCGAAAPARDEVQHFPGCYPGLWKNWEGVFNELPEDPRPRSVRKFDDQ